MPEPPIDEALAVAEDALAARHESPAESMAAARRVVDRDDVSDVARLVGLWALGLAERELSRLADAEAHLRQAIELGELIDEPDRVAQVSSALVPVLGARGKLDEALALASEIRPRLPKGDRPDLDMKRALILEQMGRLSEALESYTTALAGVERGDDRVLEARLRCNRAIVFAYQGHLDEALADSLIAERLAVEHHQFFLAGGAAHNHAFAAGLQGDIVTALASFARADELYGRVGHPGRSAGVLASDRCELMLIAGLNDEARANAELAVRSLDAVGDVSDLAEAQLLLARACLAQGDAMAARRSASIALERFQRDGRAGWAAVAEYVAVTAAEAASPADADTWRRGGAIAVNLERLGWSAEAASVRVASAELALRNGDTTFARSQLTLAAASRERGRADLRASAWLATAMLRRADLDRAGARRAVTAGLDVLARHQATLGSTDLRVGATTHARKLANLGLGMAVESRKARDVLSWAERVRANALSIPTIRPPADSPLVAALGELRRRRTELDEARRALEADHRHELAVRQMESTVRELARSTPGAAEARRRFSVEDLQQRLGPDRQLVEYVESDGTLMAVVTNSRGCRLRGLGTVDELAGPLELALFALTRLARDGASSASRSASIESLGDSAERLDRLLVRPLRLADDPVVVVPTGALHSMPWGSLPSLSRLPTSVATSATRWSPPPIAEHPGAAVGLITGPGLSQVSRELAVVASRYRVADRLTGDAATVAASLALLERSTVAHVACHGHFRSDSPMFSSLALADGPLTVYDVEGLATSPSVVVLPACNAGTSSVGVGDELIGTASALLGVGVRAVIAPVTVVNDAATVDVMATLHRYLASGHPPAAALALTRTDIAATGDPAALASARSFLSLE